MKKIDETANPSIACVFVEENDPRGYNSRGKTVVLPSCLARGRRSQQRGT